MEPGYPTGFLSFKVPGIYVLAAVLEIFKKNKLGGPNSTKPVIGTLGLSAQNIAELLEMHR